MKSPSPPLHHLSQRSDLLLATEIVTEGARVLDIGCEHGELLHLLKREKKVDGRGLELSQEGVNACVASGLSVIQGDADTDLLSYPDDAFDYVILTQTIQATRRPKHVVEELLRIGKHAIISFPNFAHWRVRASLLISGKMPMTPSLSLTWHETPNIHLCSIRDFVDLCEDLGARIDRAYSWSRDETPKPTDPKSRVANLMAEHAMFVLS